MTAEPNCVAAWCVGGTSLHAAAVNVHQARAAAGITMALGAAAFVFANFDELFWPIRTVSSFFFVDFLVRITAGLERSPSGLVAGWMTRRQTPQWVSAKPKRFAWTLGLVMALAMTVITNFGIHGPLPRTICLICLALMWRRRCSDSAWDARSTASWCDTAGAQPTTRSRSVPTAHARSTPSTRLASTCRSGLDHIRPGRSGEAVRSRRSQPAAPTSGA